MEEIDTPVECLVERLLLGSNSLLYDLAALLLLGENNAHRVHQHVNKLIKKRLAKPERAAVAHGAAQDAAQDVVAIGVPRLDAVGDRETQRADMVAYDTEGNVGFFLLSLLRTGQCGGVLFAAQFSSASKMGLKTSVS